MRKFFKKTNILNKIVRKVALKSELKKSILTHESQKFVFVEEFVFLEVSANKRNRLTIFSFLGLRNRIGVLVRNDPHSRDISEN